MKILFTTLTIILIFASCTSDLGEVTVTYTRGDAIYGDLSSIRQTPLTSSAREVADAGKIFISNDLLLIGEETEGIHVFDNTDPENPVAQLFINIPGNREFYVDGDFIYAESLYDMLKIDISNPQQPQLVSRIENAISPTLTNWNGETLIGFEFETVTESLDKDSDVYNQIWNTGDNVYFDFEQNMIPPSAVPSSFAGNSSNQIGSINRIAELDGFVYVISRVNLGVYEADNFQQVFQGPIGWNMETIYPMGNRLFIGTNNSVDIYNVDDPYNPTYEAGFWHATSCDPVFPVSESTAYATLRTGEFATCPGDINALVVLDVSNEWSVNQVQEIQMSSPYGLTKIGDLLYVGEGKNGLRIFDATNERSLELVKWDQQVTAYDVLAHPTRPDQLLITGPEGIGQYRIGSSNQELQLLSRISY